MTRVTDLSSHNTMVSLMLATQERLHQANEQVASEKVSNKYSGVDEAQRLVNLENEAALSNQYLNNNTTADIRLQVSYDAIEAIRDTISNFEEQLQDFRRSDTTDSNSVTQIQTFAFQAMLEMEAYLNTTADGQYVFSGSKVQTEPVDLDLTSLAAFQDIFNGDSVEYPTTRDAHISNFEITNDEELKNATLIDNNNWLKFTRDEDGDVSDAATGSIEASNAAFSDMTAGMEITITNAGVNNGTYSISSVSSDHTKIYINTEALTDEGITSALPIDLPNSAVATIGLPDGTNLTTTNTGLVTFDKNSQSITATTVGSFSGISAGDTVEVSGVGVNSGSYTVDSIVGETINIKINTTATITTFDDVELNYEDFNNLSFDRENSTITSLTADAFTDMEVGESFVVAGTTANDGTYTISANDGTTLTIESKMLTDSGLEPADSISKFVDEAIIDGLTGEANVAAAVVTLPNGTSLSAANSDFTDLTFATDGTIIAADGLAFTDLASGDTFTVSGTTSNNGTYTIGNITGNGSTINVLTSTEALTTDATDGTATFTLSDGSSVAVGTTVSFNAAGTITQDDTSTWALSAGDVFTVTNANNATNDGTYLVSSLSDSGGTNDVLTIQQVPNEVITLSDGVTTLDYTNYGNLVFDADNNTMTAETGASLAGITVGDTFTIAGSDYNNGTYTVSANDGTTLTISAVEYNDSSDILFQMPIGSEAIFDNTSGASNVQIVTPNGTPLDVFSGLKVGDGITLSGASSYAEMSDEAIVATLTDEASVSAGTITLPDGSTLSSTDFSDLSFLATDATITAGGGANPFSTVSAGDVITISGTTSNDGTYTVGTVTGSNTILNIKTSTETLSNDANDSGVSIDLASGTQLTNGTTGDISFSAAGTLTLDNNSNWASHGLSVGDTFTVTGSNTASNDGTYIVSALSDSGGTNDVLTIQQLPTETITLPDTSTLNYTDYGDIVFNEDASTITSTAGDFTTDLSAGDTFTLSGTTNNDGTYVVGSVSANLITIEPADNNATLTVASISSDGSTITFNEDLSLSGRDVDGLSFSGPNGYEYSAGTQAVFDATDDYIEVQTIGNSTAVAGAFSDMRVGMTIDANFTGSNDGSYTISSISSDGSRIYVSEDITVDETDNQDAVFTVYGTSGTINAENSYYQGDENTNSHRLDENRSFEFDMTAVDAGFEKAIRAMGIIAQGGYGSAGGLDNEENRTRISDAIYLLNDAIDTPAEGSGPYGDEIETSSINQMEINIGYRQMLLNSSNTQHSSFIAFLETNIARIENVDPLEAITRLLDESRTLEASYQALSKVRALSLHNYL